ATGRALSGRPHIQRVLSQPEGGAKSLARGRAAGGEEQSPGDRGAAYLEGGGSAGISRGERQRRLRIDKLHASALRARRAREDRLPGDPVAEWGQASVHPGGRESDHHAEGRRTSVSAPVG